MANKQKQQQKKRERKAAKRKAQLKAKTSKPQSLASRASTAAKHPIHECLVSETLFEDGIGQALLSRTLPNGLIALSAFLLDTWCLGVKDAMFRIVEPEEYERHLLPSLSPISAECLRAIIEGSEDYAGKCGLKPHEDYPIAARLFGEIDAQRCTELYEYGCEGKPRYISGLDDTPTRIQQIITLLEQHLGAGNFEVVLPEEVWSEEAEWDDDEQDPPEWAELGITSEPMPEAAFDATPESVQAMYEELYRSIFDDPAAAIPKLESLIQQYPDVPSFVNHLYLAYSLNENLVEAKRAVALMRERFPDYLFGKVTEAQEHLLNGEPHRVAELFGDASTLQELYPGQERFHITEALAFYTIRGLYCAEVGDRAGAQSCYEIMVKLDPFNSRTLMLQEKLSEKSMLSHAQDFLSSLKS